MNKSGSQGQNFRLWIDLSGFSGKGSDLGVRDFLDNLGFTPSAISLLSCCPDIVHEYDGVIDDAPLRWEYSSYGAWKRNFRWTGRMLKHVVKQLQKHGVKVYFSTMSQAYHPHFEIMSDWAKKNKELWLVHDTGLHGFCSEGKFADTCFYNIAARFRDGSYYEDFFASKVVRMVVDYGFDGFHAADGYKSFILGIMAAGFSPDILEQFENDSGITLPSYRGAPSEVIPPVAKWIWRNKRLEWIDFWRRRLGRSWKKVGKQLKTVKKDFAINSCWCTDPLESISRYGMDTTALQESSVESINFETDEIYTLIGPASGPKSQRREGYILENHEFYSTSLIAALLRGVHTPKIKLFPMIHVHDQFERFEFLKSGRAHLEKTITGFQQLYRLRNNKLESATAGLWPTIPMDVSAEDWRFLRTCSDTARSIRPADIPGAIALWSESTIENEIPTSQKYWSVHRSIYEIAAAGCPIITAAHVRESDNLRRQVLFWANPASFSKDEQLKIWKFARVNRLIIFDAKGDYPTASDLGVLTITDAHSGARLVITGTKTQLDKARSWVVQEAELMASKNLLAAVKHRNNSICVTPAKKAKPHEYRKDMEAHFMTRLPPTRLALPYLELAAGIARKIAWPMLDEVRVYEGSRVGELAGRENNLFYIKAKNGKLYLFAENYCRYASYLEIQWAKPVLKSKQINSVMFHPAPQGRRAELMIPAGGITIYEVCFKT